MNEIIDLKRIILALTIGERENLPKAVCESLIGDPGAASDRRIDPEAIDIAAQRDADVASAHVRAIDRAEFLWRIAGVPECHGF